MTSTGGTGSFKQEWAKEFEAISEVYVYFDNEEAGRNGALRVAHLVPRSKSLEFSRR